MEKVYQMVTDRIIEQMNKGIIPWHKPWHLAGNAEDSAINYVTRRPYSVINQWLLGDTGEYLQSWVKNLKNDPKALVVAAGKAAAAVGYILNGKKAE